jgi:hypothetical protein
MAFAGVRAFCAGHCCEDSGCDVGEDQFAEPLGSNWSEPPDGWETSGGVLVADDNGSLIFQPHAGEGDPIKVTVLVMPAAGSPAKGRVLVGWADDDNHLFVEIRAGDGGCCLMQVGWRRGGSETWLSDPEPITYDDGIGATFAVQVCYLPGESLQAVATRV